MAGDACTCARDHRLVYHNNYIYIIMAIYCNGLTHYMIYMCNCIVDFTAQIPARCYILLKKNVRYSVQGDTSSVI